MRIRALSILGGEAKRECARWGREEAQGLAGVGIHRYMHTCMRGCNLNVINPSVCPAPHTRTRTHVCTRQTHARTHAHANTRKHTKYAVWGRSHRPPSLHVEKLVAKPVTRQPSGYINMNVYIQAYINVATISLHLYIYIYICACANL